MHDPRDAKAQLRERMRRLRDALPPGRRDACGDPLAESVLQTPKMAAARCVFCYLAVGSETPTQPLIRRLFEAGIAVAAPRVVGRGLMIAQPLRSPEAVNVDRFGIPAPDGEPVEAETVDVAIVPGLAFTRAGDRLGMGMGFYDRWLSRHPQTLAIGICYREQLLDCLPVEPHDRRVQRVLVAE